MTRIQLVQRGTAATLPDEERALLQEAGKAATEIGGLLSAMLTLVNPGGEESEAALRLTIQGSLLEMKPILAAAGATVEVRNELKASVPGNLKRVIKELLTNACKFRDRSRPLRILVGTRLTEDGKLEIEVSDNGLGAAPDYLEQIFIPFQRLHSREEFPGYGLGLSICRRIVEDFGGTIAARAQPEGLAVTVGVPHDK